MKSKSLVIVALLALLGSTLAAQDISGKWQGTIDQGQQKARVILTIDKLADGRLQGKFYSLELFPDFHDWGAFVPLDLIFLRPDLKFTVPYRVGFSYSGKLSGDGNSINGTWTLGQPVPLRFDRATPSTEWKDPSPHTVRFVTVDQNVKLEVLDWGGAGRPLVFLAGGGATGHMFDEFAPKFKDQCRVYAITRRGFGASSAPASGYEADRLGDDVIAVLDALKLDHPVLAGVSIAGEEMSSVGSRHPERVAGLIYLDAGYSYAYYDSARGDMDVDIVDLRNKLEQFKNGEGPEDLRPLIRELLERDLPQFEKDLRAMQAELKSEPASDDPTRKSRPVRPPLQAMFDGFRKYTRIPVPILNIYAYPHYIAATDPKRAALEASDQSYTGAQADAFEKGVPSARVVRLPNARHNLIVSNEADVIREMNAFLAILP